MATDFATARGTVRSLRGAAEKALGLAQTRASYTVAQLPAPATATGKIVFVSNGNAGQPCLAYSNGTAWKVIALGATAAAS